MATKIGPYNILRVLGHGGMGVVYQATDSRDRRMVAIKMILVETSAELYRMALVREASATSKLQHPNIVSIYDIAQQRGQLYFVMEYLEGAPLDKLIRSKQPLSLPQKLNIVIQLCDALDYAHQHGVIHRDVKPANIFILRNGIVKLVDFGLAAILEVSNSKGRAGTIPYMSPEQVNATVIDGRSDIWSAGITLYELLAGKVPFIGTESQVFHHILYSPTPKLDPAFPEEVNQRLAKALSKNKDERYQTAGAFGAALREIQYSLSKKGMPVPELPQRLSRFQPVSKERYEELDLGFRQDPVGTVVLSTETFRMMAVVRAVEIARKKFDKNLLGVLLIVSFLVPVVVVLSLVTGMGYYLFLLLFIVTVILGVLNSSIARILLWTEIFLTHPRCTNCHIPMLARTNWIGFVNSDTGVVEGYGDCIAALKRGLWRDAAKLHSMYGSTHNPFTFNDFRSVQSNLEFYECEACNGHVARLTTDDLVEGSWVRRREFTETYQGSQVVPATHTWIFFSRASAFVGGTRQALIAICCVVIVAGFGLTRGYPASWFAGLIASPDPEATQPHVTGANETTDGSKPDAEAREGISALVKKLSWAFTDRSISELEEIWPRMGASKVLFEKTFNSTRSMTREFHIDAIVVHGDDLATVTGTYKGTIRKQADEVPQSGNFFLALYERERIWYIDSATF